eukprot:11177488-Lingulodinium_polyedra.AAC.1
MPFPRTAAAAGSQRISWSSAMALALVVCSKTSCLATACAARGLMSQRALQPTMSAAAQLRR